MSRQLARDIVESARRDMVIGVRAGQGSHRFTAVWSVVVDGRVFARSWSRKRDGWRAALSHDRSAVVQIGGAEIPVRAVLVRSERINEAVDDAYRSKYHTAASAVFVDDLTAGESRASTVEFVPDLGGGHDELA